MPQTTFAKRVLNQPYIAVDKTAYTNGAVSGRRFSIFYPEKPAADYPVNASHPGTYSYVMFGYDETFTSSTAVWADASATTISPASAAVNVGMGIIWQLVMNGVAAVGVQFTAAAAGQGVTGDGLIHPPGGASGIYEGLARPNSKSDAVDMVQHLQEFAASYGLCSTSWCVLSNSGGADAMSWCALAPSRAYELGSFGQYTRNTIPNVAVLLGVVVMYWPYMDGTVAIAAFPTAENGASAAATLAAAPARYLRETSAYFYISEFGAPCIPHVWYSTDVASASLRFGLPYPTAVATGSPHTVWFGLALRNAFPKGQVYLSTGTTGDDVGGTSVLAYVDDNNHSGAGSFDTEGAAAIYKPEDSAPNSALNYVLRYINSPRWDTVLPPNGIFRRGQVSSVGRFVVPPRGNRAGVVLRSTSRPLHGESGLSWGFGPDSTVGHLPAGGEAFIPTRGPLWVAADGDSTKVARYAARETARS